jgi:hypothetical protein
MANHKHAIAPHFFHHNFRRKHVTLTAHAGGVHITPAMASGLTDHVRELEEIVTLMVSHEARETTTA